MPQTNSGHFATGCHYLQAPWECSSTCCWPRQPWPCPRCWRLAQSLTHCRQSVCCCSAPLLLPAVASMGLEVGFGQKPAQQGPPLHPARHRQQGTRLWQCCWQLPSRLCSRCVLQDPHRRWRLLGQPLHRFRGGPIGQPEQGGTQLLHASGHGAKHCQCKQSISNSAVAAVMLCPTFASVPACSSTPRVGRTRKRSCHAALRMTSSSYPFPQNVRAPLPDTLMVACRTSEEELHMPVIPTADEIGGVLLTGYSATWLGLVAAGRPSAGAVGPQHMTWGSAGLPLLAWLPSAGDSGMCCYAAYAV